MEREKKKSTKKSINRYDSYPLDSCSLQTIDVWKFRNTTVRAVIVCTAVGVSDVMKRPKCVAKVLNQSRSQSRIYNF